MTELLGWLCYLSWGKIYLKTPPIQSTFSYDHANWAFIKSCTHQNCNTSWLRLVYFTICNAIQFDSSSTIHIDFYACAYHQYTTVSGITSLWHPGLQKPFKSRELKLFIQFSDILSRNMSASSKNKSGVNANPTPLLPWCPQYRCMYHNGSQAQLVLHIVVGVSWKVNLSVVVCC